MNTILNHKKILLGITGGIAAYKAAELARRLKDNDCDVQVVMTESANQFITPLTFQALTGKKVRTQLFDEAAEMAMSHIELARWPDAIIIAPASANIIAKIALGLADDLLTTLCLASTAKIIIAPAMNMHMWEKTITQQHIQQLQLRGIIIIPPETGYQACGDYGKGRMAEPDTIMQTLLKQTITSNLLAKKTVVITASATQEPIDPVRFITNHSTGKMGFALAHAAKVHGANVILISGPTALTPPENINFHPVVTAAEMFAAVKKYLSQCDIFIGAAAVTDFSVAKNGEQKIAKANFPKQLTLTENPDIIAYIAEQKNKPFVVGFSAETHDVIKNAQAKLKRKNLDMIIANQVNQPHTGFAHDTNACVALFQNQQREFTLTSKTNLAMQLMELIINEYTNRRTTQNS